MFQRKGPPQYGVHQIRKVACLEACARLSCRASIEVIVNLMNKSTKTPSAASLRSKRQVICLRPHLLPWKQAWSGTKFIAKTIKDLVDWDQRNQICDRQERSHDAGKFRTWQLGRVNFASYDYRVYRHMAGQRHFAAAADSTRSCEYVDIGGFIADSLPGTGIHRQFQVGWKTRGHLAPANAEVEFRKPRVLIVALLDKLCGAIVPRKHVLLQIICFSRKCQPKPKRKSSFERTSPDISPLGRMNYCLVFDRHYIRAERQPQGTERRGPFAELEEGLTTDTWLFRPDLIDANFEATNPHCYSLKKTIRQRTVSRQDTRSRDDLSLNFEGNTESDPSPDGHWEGGDTVDGMVIPANSSRTIGCTSGYCIQDLSKPPIVVTRNSSGTRMGLATACELSAAREVSRVESSRRVTSRDGHPSYHFDSIV
ncbi:hypothetical protein DFH08DRAFT_811738 [Mycena albidolilacea]|uniref:Uncharacterized protein n=1 Tax=Mycena albidolilacea TaxID=1033008 RepID=A0AAD7ENB2_9AGAR|nr:hypothetical protein DFH08DRAFT_811738 [Mycena albidolilacea]